MGKQVVGANSTQRTAIAADGRTDGINHIYGLLKHGASFCLIKQVVKFIEL
jgi:hypothetical protein